MPVTNRPWIHHKMWAEIKDRGFSTSALEKSLGLKHGDIFVAFKRPYAKTDKALANWLKIPLFELWSDRYYPNGMRHVRQTYPNREIVHASSKMGAAACTKLFVLRMMRTNCSALKIFMTSNLCLLLSLNGRELITVNDMLFHNSKLSQQIRCCLNSKHPGFPFEILI